MTAKRSLLIMACAGLMLGKPKIKDDLKNVPNNDTRSVIVVFAKDKKDSGKTKIKDKKPKKTKHEYQALDAMAIEADGRTLRELAEDDDYAIIAEDQQVRASLEFANPTVGAPTARSYGWTGAGVGVAVIDSGVNAHADLGTRLVYSQSFVPGDATTGDKFGHGTHVAGIIAGNASSSSSGPYSFRGIAPAANIINLRVLDGTGKGFDSDIIAAIDRAIALKATYNIRVMNLSFGRPVRMSAWDDPLNWAVQRAWWDNGIVVVASAGNAGRDNSRGNQGYGTIMCPGNDPFIITVGAARDMGNTSRADDSVTSYSSKGPTNIDQFVKPDLVAPGNAVVSLRASGSLLDIVSNRIMQNYYLTGGSASTAGPYMRLSGTSMAAPMVSGAAALLIQKTPALSPDVVKARLMRTATKTFPAQVNINTLGVNYTIRNDMFTMGAGYLDVWAALNNNDTFDRNQTYSDSPVAQFNAATNRVELVPDSWLIWNVATSPFRVGNTWTSTSVSNVSGTNVVWGNNVVWGDSTSTAYQVLWGDSVLWGDNVVWGDSANWAQATGRDPNN